MKSQWTRSDSVPSHHVGEWPSLVAGACLGSTRSGGRISPPRPISSELWMLALFPELPAVHPTCSVPNSPELAQTMRRYVWCPASQAFRMCVTLLSKVHWRQVNIGVDSEDHDSWLRQPGVSPLRHEFDFDSVRKRWKVYPCLTLYLKQQGCYEHPKMYHPRGILRDYLTQRTIDEIDDVRRQR